MISIQNVAPKEIWKNFSLINAIPRASKKEEAISKFIMSFGKNLGLEVHMDAALNVLIKKPASSDCKTHKTVVLQAHLDMVHQKNEETEFDFDREGIQMFVEGDWIKAKGTTLGADNGLGVAAIMAVLESKTIQHPNIEALFTVDEETGMTGAFALEPNFLTGSILLNLDTEEDNEITIGCAGGIDFTAQKPLEYRPNPYLQHYRIQLKGLQGGHSGIDIHKGLGNANLLLIRFLYELNLNTKYVITNLKGGNLRNAIPREAFAEISVEDRDVFKENAQSILLKITKEWQFKEPNLRFEIVEYNPKNKAIHSTTQNEILSALHSCFNGVYTMDAAIKDLVATSNNLSSISLQNNLLEVCCLTRSSIESEKEDLIHKLTANFQLAGFHVKTEGSYPGWQAQPNTKILKTIVNTYQTLFHEAPVVNACHAGLECGIIGAHYPELEMVSFGPTIRGAHSPEEKASISSSQKFWTFLKAILFEISNES